MPAVAEAAPREAGAMEAPNAVDVAAVYGMILRMQGFPSILRVTSRRPDGSSAAPPHKKDARFLICLREPVPVMHIAGILWRLQQSAFACAAVFRVTELPESPYGEELHVADDLSLIKIERRFHKALGKRSVRRLAAAVVKIVPGDEQWVGETVHFSPWMLIRHTLAEGGSINGVSVPMREPLTNSQALDAVVQSLPPNQLAHLARIMGMRSIAPRCFAEPSVSVAPGAVLRGPLFVSGPMAITDSDICIGPRWVRGDSSAAFTRRLPSSDVSPADPRSGFSWPPGAPEKSGPASGYFSGPRTKAKPIYEACKRLFDVAGASAALAALLPVGIVVAIVVKTHDGGPVFFCHRREGLLGRPFGCIKFRTMKVDAEAAKKDLRKSNQVDGPQFKLANDPRITPVGRFLRKTNLDEVPQLLNVLWGQMSIVGPRPSPFEENQMCPPWREARLSVKPGITGLWQVSRSRHRGPADFQEWIMYDTQYVERRNFFLDMKVVLLTIKEILGKGQ